MDSENLYPSSPLPTNTTPIVTQAATSGFDLGQFIYNLNTFALAWSILYSIFFTANFFYYRIRNAEGDLNNEKIGVESLRYARRLWITYLYSWVFVALYVFSPVELVPYTSILAVIALLAKLVIFDAPVIPYFKLFLPWFADKTLLEIIGVLFGGLASIISSMLSIFSQPPAEKKPTK